MLALLLYRVTKYLTRLRIPLRRSAEGLHASQQAPVVAKVGDNWCALLWQPVLIDDSVEQLLSNVPEIGTHFNVLKKIGTGECGRA